MSRRIIRRRPSTAKRSSFGQRSQGSAEYSALELRKLLAADILSSSSDGQWLGLATSSLTGQTGDRYIHFSRFGLFDLQEDVLAKSLKNVQLESSPGSLENALTISVPRPDLTFDRFLIVEAPVMDAALAAEFPDIKTYRGVGVDDPAASIRLDTTMHGFHAQVLTPNGSWMVDPYFHLQTGFYASYFRADALQEAPDSTRHHAAGNGDEGCGCGCGCGCGGCTVVEGLVGTGREGDDGEQNPRSTENFGTQLRTFRLANAATGEYTAFHGGTVAAGQAAIVTAVNRVTGVYEKDLAIRLTLVANNSSLVYTNSGTDPYTNNNGSTMLGQNQTTVDSVIGNANYDIGHVFSTGGGGIAGLGVVGSTGNKARGVTGSGSPTGDAFWIDYVAHEMGHQFGSNHSFNGTGGSCSGNRSAANAYEPGSGTSIMSYAGICGADDVQANSDAMFNAESIADIRAFINGIPAVGTTTSTGNSVPTVNAGLDYAIPTGTPFELTAVGSDANSGQVLTYSWEQRDLGAALTLAAADNGASPLFRVWNPTTSPTRVFPRLSNLVNNTVPVGEKLPTVARPSMDFRVVVRDNASGGGGVNWDDMIVNVVNTGAAFSVTSQNSGGSWTGLSSQTITWNVSGTSSGTVNTPNVDIWLSTDGGLTYPTLLLGATPNDGSQAITVPNVGTSQARIKVKGTNNIFFDINNANVTITPVSVTPTVNVAAPAGQIAEGDSGSSNSSPFVISLSQAAGSVVSVNYALSNAGLGNPATPGSDYTTLSGTAVFNPGETVYNIPVTIFGDRFTEGVEQFKMDLSSPSGLTLGTSTATASIGDDDAFALGRPIDFGTPTSPVQPGATGFSTGAFNSFAGVGWTASSDLVSYQLTFGSDMTRDMALTTTGNFGINLPNGNYQVQVIYGNVAFDVSRPDYPAAFYSFNTIVEGVVHPVVLEAGTNVTRTFTATVTDGRLDVGLDSGVVRRAARFSGLVVTSA